MAVLLRGGLNTKKTPFLECMRDTAPGTQRRVQEAIEPMSELVALLRRQGYSMTVATSMQRAPRIFFFNPDTKVNYSDAEFSRIRVAGLAARDIKRALVLESVPNNQGSLVRNRLLAETARHEVGHCVHYCFENLHQHKLIRQCHMEDVAGLDDGKTKAIKIYAQRNAIGRAEVMAESIAELHGGGIRPEIKDLFPRTFTATRISLAGNIPSLRNVTMVDVMAEVEISGVATKVGVSEWQTRRHQTANQLGKMEPKRNVV